jgi:hypothetical protein
MARVVDIANDTVLDAVVDAVAEKLGIDPEAVEETFDEPDKEIQLLEALINVATQIVQGRGVETTGLSGDSPYRMDATTAGHLQKVVDQASRALYDGEKADAQARVNLSKAHLDAAFERLMA